MQVSYTPEVIKKVALGFRMIEHFSDDDIVIAYIETLDGLDEDLLLETLSEVYKQPNPKGMPDPGSVRQMVIIKQKRRDQMIQTRLAGEAREGAGPTLAYSAPHVVPKFLNSPEAKEMRQGLGYQAEFDV